MCIRWRAAWGQRGRVFGPRPLTPYCQPPSLAVSSPQVRYFPALDCGSVGSDANHVSLPTAVQLRQLGQRRASPLPVLSRYGASTPPHQEHEAGVATSMVPMISCSEKTGPTFSLRFAIGRFGTGRGLRVPELSQLLSRRKTASASDLMLTAALLSQAMSRTGRRCPTVPS